MVVAEEPSLTAIIEGGPDVNITQTPYRCEHVNQLIKDAAAGQASFSDHGFEVVTSVSPRKQLVDLAVGMAVDDLGERTSVM